MLYEKKKIFIHRLIWFILLLFGILIPIIISAVSDDALIAIMVFIYADVFIFAFFIASLLLSCKIYEYNGNDIVVYSGFYHHYIKVNDTIIDEHNTLVSFTAIPLSCTLDDGTDIKVTITMTNRISMKINNQLYTKLKLK